MPDETTPVLICDLDGTILRRNSFPFWIIYLIFGPLPELEFPARAKLSFRTQRLLLRRKLGRIDHERLMCGVQYAWHAAAGGDQGGDQTARRIPAMLRRLVRPSLEPLLDQVAMGEVDAVLATAAAGEYAIELGRQLGFRHILATPCRLASDEKLNSGPRKFLRVAQFLDSQGWHERPRVLLTDHIDDLPLMRHCDAVGWFGSMAAMTHARELTAGVPFTFCQRLDATAMSSALAAMAPRARSFAASGLEASTLA